MQLAPAATLPEQPFVTISPLVAPEMLEIVKGAPPVLVTVTVFVLEVPMTVSGRAAGNGVIETAARATALAVTGTALMAAFAALLLIVRSPEWLPTSLGWYLTDKVHEPLGAKLDVQLLTMPYWADGAVTLETVSGLMPVLVTIMV